ncbi:MAG: cysteine--tRNA ligase [Salinisphaera sp.]|nr:cysteine--tRNA ligase [Salinisphaera sp.]
MQTIYNSLTGKKEVLRPLRAGRVGLYVCGITVYDYCHLGHARAMVVFDLVVRYLRSRGLTVTFVRNITDIDDKIIRRAAETAVSPQALAERFTRAMHEDAAALGLLPPDAEPRATAHIGQIVAMIEALNARGFAYAPGNGDVYYDVSAFGAYGALSGKRPDQLRAGARVALDEAKDDPLDFVLWKAAKPGEPAWDSPWGPGRPGWHIECSAMSTHCLGQTFDIHGGGADLQFPHHENEIAQSEAASGKPFAKLWMHNGFVTVDEEKMAKSLGNFLTIREVLVRWPAETVRYFILSSHYRSPLAYAEDQLAAAQAALDRLYQALRGQSSAAAPANSEIYQRFHAAMADDFNTPEALAVLFEAAREANRLRASDGPAAARMAAVMRRLGATVGLLQTDPEQHFQGRVVVEAGQGRAAATGKQFGTHSGFNDEEVEEKIRERTGARARGDFEAADRIRDHLLASGVVVEDGPNGTMWRRARRGADH